MGKILGNNVEYWNCDDSIGTELTSLFLKHEAHHTSCKINVFLYTNRRVSEFLIEMLNILKRKKKNIVIFL